MPSLPDTVRLFIGGLVHDDWDAYDIDSDLLIPADAWRVGLSLKEGRLPEQVVEGAEVQVRIGDDLVMTGRIDEIGEKVSKSGLHFDIGGRDGAAVLVDCSSPIFSAQMASLDEVVAKVVKKLGVKTVRIVAENKRIREKVTVEPGEMAWETLTNAAEANGLWPWFEPDGTLIVGGPDYSQAPVASLILRRSGEGNNVLSLERRRSIVRRYSELTVLGQRRGNHTAEGRHDLKGEAYDHGVSWYRPRIMVDYEADSSAVCRTRARKLLTDGRLNGMTLMAEVAGPRIVAPGQPGDGLLWKPTQRVHVLSEPHGIDAVFFLMARRFSGGRHQEPRTQLTLKEDRSWLIDAHPHKKRHRLGKNSTPMQVLDTSYSSFMAEAERYYQGKGK